MNRPHVLGWVPAFVVGACLASAAELAVGLLIYSGPGFLRSVTTVLALEAGALAVGLWSAPRPRADLQETLRRRWLLCLGSFLVATLFAAGWTLVHDVGGTALGQGLGLAALAGLPLYASGGLLGGLAAVDQADELRAPGSIGARAALGAVVGFLATGAALTRVLTPSSLMLGCIIMLSAGGLVYTYVQDGRVRTHVKGSHDSPFGEVRVEERVLPVAGPGVRALVEGTVLRAWTPLEGPPFAAWDVAFLRTLLPDESVPFRVLLVGGGASSAPRSAVRQHPSVTVEVLERSSTVVDLGAALMDTVLSVGTEGRMSVQVGNLEDLAGDLEGLFDLVAVDTASLRPVGGDEALSAHARATLLARVADGGVLVAGPLPTAVTAWPIGEGWSVRAFRRVPAAPLGRLYEPGAAEEVVVVACAPPIRAFPPPEGFAEREP